MFTSGILILALAAQQPSGKVESQPKDEAVKAIDASGRCSTVAESPDERVAAAKQIAPGKPPVLSFRLYEAKTHRGSSSNGLMLDDAGH
jgi:hypothetical protein